MLAGRLFHQLASQLDPLRFAAGERGRRLAELHVVEAHRVQRLELVLMLGMFSKCSSACWMSISSTSAIDLPLYSTCSDSWLNRWPWQTLQVNPHVGQEVHFEFVRAVAAACFAATARYVEAKPPRLVPTAFRLGQLCVERRMSSNTLMYVAGLERGVRPMGDWSMAIILSRCSRPSIRS